MQLTGLITIAAALTSAVIAPVSAVPATSSTNAALSITLGSTMTTANHYGAPIPPWKKGAKPGWYYGDHPEHLDIFKFFLPHLKDSLICKLLDLLPFCLHCPKPHAPPPPPPPQYPPPSPPPPSDGWKQTFSDLTAATQADGYLTYGLVDTVDDCKAMCSSVQGCVFINTYHDVNGKDGSPLLTCSLYTACQGPETAINAGGQSQPDGSINYITNSDGFCYAGY
ncbi:hypothetical protein D9758_007077 [Tetrapyrgos nigripes]|uniref:Fruit-body specific protein a n=1 Tax=Tetrapyrgos nigripes TaxID=182062 RepID=A0A8H5GDF9_9AGAR|nr:hypothetical protein D9758_007077 [Tetrapyrgos nigripes]